MYPLFCFGILFTIMKVFERMNKSGIKRSYFQVWPLLIIVLITAIAGILDNFWYIFSDSGARIRLSVFLTYAGWLGALMASLGVTSASFVRDTLPIHKIIGCLLAVFLYPLVLVSVLPERLLTAKPSAEWTSSALTAKTVFLFDSAPPGSGDQRVLHNQSLLDWAKLNTNPNTVLYDASFTREFQTAELQWPGPSHLPVISELVKESQFPHERPERFLSALPSAKGEAVILVCCRSDSGELAWLLEEGKERVFHDKKAIHLIIPELPLSGFCNRNTHSPFLVLSPLLGPASLMLLEKLFYEWASIVFSREIEGYRIHNQ